MSGSIARGSVTGLDDQPMYVVVWMVREGKREAEAFPIYKDGPSADVDLCERVLEYKRRVPFHATMSYQGASVEMRRVTGLTLTN